MRIHRTKNAARNIFFDGLSKIVNMLMPFLMRTVMLHYLGVEYLGLNGLFRSILSFLNLAELGVGSAMVFSMYKPIAEDDTETICALTKLYRTFYRIIGIFIATVGLALTPFLNVLIKGEVTADVNLYILYFMNLGSTVMTYWLFAYKSSLIIAHQRNDIGSKISLVVHFTEYIIKILVLVFLRNYYVYLIVQLMAQASFNLLIAWRVTKIFPQYKPRGQLPREKVRDITQRVRDLFTAKFSHVIVNSADTLVISSFLGLTILAIYQNYYFVISSLCTLQDVIISACLAGIGNSLVTESVQKNYGDLRRFTLLFGWVMGVTTAMLLCLYQPFMFLWMGEENLLGFSFVVCFAVYYYSIGMNKIINMFKDAAGIWHRDRFRPLTSALVNLGLNLATVKTLGLYGVLLSTVVSIVLVQVPWLLHNLFHEVFPHEYLWQYTREFGLLALVALLACGASWYLCGLLSLGPWLSLLFNAFVSFTVPNVIFFLIYGRNPMLISTAQYFIKKLAKKLGRNAA